MIALATIFALCVLMAMGAAALSAVGIRDRFAPTALAAEFAAGVVVLAVLGMTTIALGGQLSSRSLYVALALLVCAAILRRRTLGRSSPEDDAIPAAGPLPGDRRALALRIAATIVWLVLLTAATRDRLAWDGWAFWTLKARVLFEDGTLPPAVLDPGGAYDYAHPDYPLAVPLVDWWIFRHAGTVRTALASVTGAVWLGLLAVTLWRSARPVAGARFAALAALGITTFWPVSHYAIGGYADVVMGLAVLGAVVEIDRYGRANDLRALGRFALFLALAAAAKNEGLALATVGSAVGAGMLVRRRERRVLAYAALALPILVRAPWWWFTRRLGLESAILSGTTPAWEVAIGRIPGVAAALLELGLTRSWIPLPFLAAIGFALVVRRRGLDVPAAWLIVIGYLVVLMAVYLVTPLDHIWLLDTSLSRLMGTLVPATVLLALGELYGEASRRVAPAGDPEGVAAGYSRHRLRGRQGDAMSREPERHPDVTSRPG